MDGNTPTTNTTSRATANRRAANRGLTTYRWMRQIHLWIGAWGALAAVLYGITGFVMNHRFDMVLPQGDSVEVARLTIAVPEELRTDPDGLLTWLAATHDLRDGSVRQGPPGRGPGRGGSDDWLLRGGNARNTWSANYTPGAATIEFSQSQASWLASANRLHKSIGGTAWILLSDSFAIAMTLLGITGLWMWARGRRPRTLVLSVVGVSTLVTVVILGPALF
ncbi:MAG: PepSY-associated TM helix domain-containing protein [Xanthomonadales bacterium]|nr:PepSY-associated TM helix domain-containing protein [Xanthomonadales bacterium]